MTDENDAVEDEEILYRRICANHRCKVSLYSLRDDGTIKISSMAFQSRDLRISVDRAKLHGNHPERVLEHEDDGAVSLIAHDVRAIVGLERAGNSEENVQFRMDVEPVPLPENAAHAEIYAIPGFVEYDKKRASRKLCELLARLTERRWEILPADLRQG